MTPIIWTILIFITLVIITWKIKKRITPIEYLLSVMLAMFMQRNADVLFSIKYDLYGYFQKGVQFKDFLPILTLYPLNAVLIVNYYPYSGIRLKKIGYIVLCAVLCTVYEWFTVKVKILYYNGWNLYWSFGVYLVVVYMLVLGVRLARYLVNKCGVSE